MIYIDESHRWDYTELAKTYDQRPEYAASAIDEFLSLSKLSVGSNAADIGAGTGKLTRMLCERGLHLTAVEPNEAMRTIGKLNMAYLPCRWVVATAEATGLPDSNFDLVSFGSSFNVVDRQQALGESARLLREDGWFVCLWNHRDLSDPLQATIEARIHELVPTYQYGVRREDQSEVIASSGMFGPVQKIEAPFVQAMSAEEIVNAWRSHGTLARQSGQRFSSIIDAISDLVGDAEVIPVPYHTRLWYAQRRAG